VTLHELPQELSDFGVLLYAGYTRRRALLLNALSALAAVAGVLLGFLAGSIIGNPSSVLLPFAAGGFLYIAAADYIPELHREHGASRSWRSFITFIVAVAFMWALRVFGTE
jgi:zinc and cadmium transporter